MIDLLIVIVNWNGERFLERCLDSVRHSIERTRLSVHSVCVDNDSSDRSREILARYPDVEAVLLDRNVGFAAANNRAFQRHDARYYLMLNPDTVMDDLDNLTKMVDYMETHREVGVAGCRLMNPDGTWQKSIGHYSSLLSGFAEQTVLNHVVHRVPVLKTIGKSLARVFTKSLSHFDESSHTGSEPVEVDFVWGAYLMFRAEVANDIGWLDETFFIFAEESDFCFRAREAGWSIQFVPVTSIVHLGGQSRKQNLTRMYYWHIAVYFWFFVKHNRWKGVAWKIGTFWIQLILWISAVIAGNRLSQLIHGQLLHLCLSRLTGRPELLRLGWERIHEFAGDQP